MSNLTYTKEQKQTLYDILDAGLEEYQIIDILDLLKSKPYKIQMAFYYRAYGMTYEEIGEKLVLPYSTVRRYIKRNCKNIKKTLQGE